MNNSISYEEYLAQNGSMTYTNVGVSMLPLLRQGRDLFILEKKGPERCRVGDVVLYRRGEKYVLHRVVEVREKDYVILGDNCVAREYGIKDDDVIGVMTGFAFLMPIPYSHIFTCYPTHTQRGREIESHPIPNEFGYFRPIPVPALNNFF